MTTDEELTVSFVSRFTSISLHTPEPLHYLRSGSHGFFPPHDTYQATWRAAREESDSDSAGEIDDSEASCVQLDEITRDQAGQDCRNLDAWKPSTNQVTANGTEMKVTAMTALVKVRQMLKKDWSPLSITRKLGKRCLSFLAGWAVIRVMIWWSAYCGRKCGQRSKEGQGD